MGTFTGERAVIKPLPKPARVEKWQKWRDTSDGKNLELVMMEHSAGGTWFATRDGQCGWYGMGMLEAPEWTFLGYAKPDKVEVGQRWHWSGETFEVQALLDDGWLRTTDGWQTTCAALLESNHGQATYLGMAESAYASNQEAESVKRDVAELQQRMLAGDNHATFAPMFRGMPFPNQGRIQVDSARHSTVQAAKIDYATADDWKAPPVQTKQTADQARQDDRRANEEAAKRLIENPPDWAYPTAWRCAVLRQLERGNRAEFMEREFSPGFCFYEELRMYHANRLSGQTHDMAKSRMNMPELCGAYARGMERPSPLMGRPGVKSGVSTCDMGADYE